MDVPRSRLWWWKTRRLGGIPADTTAVAEVVSITPATGLSTGGDTVIIEVSGIPRATSVTVGGVALTGLIRVDATHVSGTTGAHAAGAVDVVVTNSSGSTTLVGGFTYVSAVAFNILAETGDALLTEAGDNMRIE